MPKECSICIYSFETGKTFGGCELAAILPVPKEIKNYVFNCKFYKPTTPPKEEEINDK